MLQNRSIPNSPDPLPQHAGGGTSVSKPMERVYAGHRNRDGECHVWIEQFPANDPAGVRSHQPLPLHLDVHAHNAEGFAWGCGGSGTDQLALALLVDALGDRELALAHYHEFKAAHLSQWGDIWFISAREIEAFVRGRRACGSTAPVIDLKMLRTLHVAVPANVFGELEPHLHSFAGGDQTLYCLTEKMPQTELAGASPQAASWWSSFLLRLAEIRFHGDICFYPE